MAADGGPLVMDEDVPEYGMDGGYDDTDDIQVPSPLYSFCIVIAIAQQKERELEDALEHDGEDDVADGAPTIIEKGEKGVTLGMCG
jgi:hypothetical protein